MLQRPRVCILGGGFGGLYTALRLESLVWPDDRKPQVKCFTAILGIHSFDKLKTETDSVPTYMLWLPL